MPDRIDYDVEKIFEVVLAFSSVTASEQLLNIILTKMMEITRSDAGTLYILEDGKLHFRIIKNTTLNIFQSADDTIDLPPIVLNENNIENVSAYAALKNEIVIIDDVYENQRFNFYGPKNYDKITGYKTRSMLVLPLSTYWNEKAEVLGVIQLLNAVDPETGEVGPYGDILNPPVIPALANVASNTLANNIHLKEIRMLFQSFVAVMARAIDERSSYNSYHTHNVENLCSAFAGYLNSRFPEDHKYYFDEKRREELFMAAMLHDVGKIVTPLNIMDKADRLGERLPALRYRFEIKKHQLENDMLKGFFTKEGHIAETEKLKNALEFLESVSVALSLTDAQIAEITKLSEITYKNPRGEIVSILDPEDVEALSIRKGTLTIGERIVMQEHAAVTGRLLDSIAFWKYYKNVPEWARNHHEFLDGTGYPNGLDSGELSMETCIITIMDIFEALTADDRPYKKAMPVYKALNILTEMADDGKLHKELVQLFIESKVWRDIA